ncbi:MAG: DUF1016 family protein [Spirochaetaceae bacterium]|nr:DUF1016 family protein [Spirochaetaceae bacterium]
MSELIKNDSEYANWIQSICNEFKKSQIKACVKVNGEMLGFYWKLGSQIAEKKKSAKYGDNFFKFLSQDLSEKLPQSHCFSPTNLRYMERFYLLYAGETANFPQLEEDLKSVPWGHHKYIIDRFSGDVKKAVFFVRKTIENNWSRSVLLNFLDTDLYERQGKALTNFRATLPSKNSDLAQEMTKDPYHFDFLTISERYNEKELKDALEQNITKFLLELGKGFAFVGKEYRLMIGKKEKFIDMLFYNIFLHCYVVIEIKTGEFDSENIGQLGTYVSAVNGILKKEGDNQTIGLLICKSKDNVLAKYALESSSEPLGISEYEISKLFPTEFKGTLPTIEEIEANL